MNQANQQALLRYIHEVSFAIDDVVLYLDTHPCDQEALNYFREYQTLRTQAVEEYTRCYGPLTRDHVDIKNQWAWVSDPWPWEGVC